MGYYDPIPVSPISPSDDQVQNWPLISRTITDEVVQIPIPPPAAKSRPNFFLRRAKTFRSFFSRRRGSKINVAAAAAAATATTQSLTGQPTVVIKPILKAAPKPAPKPAALKPAIKPYRQATTKSKRKSTAGTVSSRASKRMTRVMSMNVQDLAATLAAPPPPPPPPPMENDHHNVHKHRSMYESFDNYTFAANMKRASVMVVASPNVMF